MTQILEESIMYLLAQILPLSATSFSWPFPLLPPGKGTGHGNEVDSPRLSCPPNGTDWFLKVVSQR